MGRVAEFRRRTGLATDTVRGASIWADLGERQPDVRGVREVAVLTTVWELDPYTYGSGPELTRLVADECRALGVKFLDRDEHVYVPEWVCFVVDAVLCSDLDRDEHLRAALRCYAEHTEERAALESAWRLGGPEAAAAVWGARDAHA